MSGQSFDVFAVDVYYYKNCYLSFACPYKSSEITLDKEEIERLKSYVIEDFLKIFERKVMKDKEAYLLTDLLEDIGHLSTENGL